MEYNQLGVEETDRKGDGSAERQREKGRGREREREREKRSAGWIRGMTASGCETLGRRGY